MGFHNLRFRVWGSGLRAWDGLGFNAWGLGIYTPIMEKQMEKKMIDEMKPVFIRVGVSQKWGVVMQYIWVK